MSDNKELDLSEEGFEGTALLNFAHDVLEQNPKLKKDSIKKAQAVVVLTLRNQNNETKSWLFDFRENGTITKLADKNDANKRKVDVSVFLKDTDFIKLVDYKTTAQKLYLNGRLKVKGNLMKGVTIELILKAADPRPKL